MYVKDIKLNDDCKLFDQVEIFLGMYLPETPHFVL